MKWVRDGGRKRAERGHGASTRGQTTPPQSASGSDHTGAELICRLSHRHIFKHTHVRCPTKALLHTHTHSHTYLYTQCLRQPDVRRISKVGSQHRAPYPLELIHFTTLPLPLFLSINLCLHLHPVISQSVCLCLLLLLFCIYLHRYLPSFSPPPLLFCFQFQQECLIFLVRQVKSWRALHASGGETPVLIKVQCRWAWTL